MRSLLVLHGFPNRVLEAICPLVGRHALRSEEVVRIWSSTMVKRGDSTEGRVCASQVKRGLISAIGSTELGGAATWESSEVMVARASQHLTLVIEPLIGSVMRGNLNHLL